jgi:hypothetical protein
MPKRPASFSKRKAKLTKAERLVAEQMLAVVEWAADHPKHWHDIGPLPASKQAAALLAKRGVIEIRQPMNQYRLIASLPATRGHRLPHAKR